jgi:hypothetical protein
LARTRAAPAAATPRKTSPGTRRLAINLLRRDKTCQRSLKGKLMRAAIDPDYLKLILKS